VLAEPELGESADPRALVRGDPAAVAATVERLLVVAADCAATARGLDSLQVRGWTGAAAAAFRVRYAELPDRWSRAAAAFRSAAQAWQRFGTELVAAQEQAAAAAARFSAATGLPVATTEPEMEVEKQMQVQEALHRGLLPVSLLLATRQSLSNMGVL